MGEQFHIGQAGQVDCQVQVVRCESVVVVVFLCLSFVESSYSRSGMRCAQG